MEDGRCEPSRGLFSDEAIEQLVRETLDELVSSLTFADHIGGALLTSGASGHLGSTRIS